MHDKDIALLEESFRRYYFEHIGMIRTPEKSIMREFGYQKFGTGMIRHLTARDDGELRVLIMENTPSDIYCSNGYYSFPNLPMADKDWQEADLIFDIDAKDLNLPCRVKHTVRKCGSCGRVSDVSECAHCGSAKHETRSLPCKDCISGAKKEVEKLLSILADDLGIDRESVQVYFSGNEGFHVHTRNTKFQKLGSKERGELANYLMFKGAIPERYGMLRGGRGTQEFPTYDEKGWRGRVARKVLTPKSKRSKIIKEIIAGGPGKYSAMLEQASSIIGANIDHGVTTDVHRIFRLPGSLNSKSGLAKIPCGNLDDFDPYDNACLIDGTDDVRVTADVPVPFRLKNKKFGPYDAKSVSVPRFAAVYMICKGLASVATPDRKGA